jgi:tetratricopeptide (TPR) repeat protein
VQPLLQAQALLSRTQIATSPDRAQLLLALGRAQLQLGDVDAAVASLAAAEQTWRGLDANNRQAGLAALHLGLALSAKGDTHAAAESWRRADAVLAPSVFTADRELLKSARQRLVS